MSGFPLPTPPAADATLKRLALLEESAILERAPGLDLALLERFAQCYKDQAELHWLDGVEPLPFDDFFHALYGVPLTPRQHWVFQQTNCLRAAKLFSPERHVQELVLVWGKGAGKGAVLAGLFAWIAYVLCHFKQDPALHFSLAPETGLVMMNVAPNEDLAKNVFFKYLKRHMAHPLLQRFTPTVLTEDVRFFRDGKHGRYEFLSVYSRHSNASGLDGHNLIAFAGDEVDDFELTQTRCAATEIHDILRSSAATRVGRGWLGAMISYPRTADGFLMTLRERALADMRDNGPRASFFTDLAATWDVRPGVSRDLPTIAEDYKNDPGMAMGKYECVPRHAGSPFFEFSEKIEEAIDESAAPVAHWRTGIASLGGREFVSVELGRIMPKPGCTYFLGGDGGVSGDTFCISVWHTEDAAASSSSHFRRWCCPECAASVPELTEGLVQWDDSATMVATREEELPLCEFCTERAPSQSLLAEGARFFVAGWWCNHEQAPDAIASSGDIINPAGERVFVPRIVEDLIITWTPQRKSRVGEINRPVDLHNVEMVCQRLMERLPIRRARFDPWQLSAMAQALRGHGGCDVETISFSQAEQYKRARLCKALLYRNLMVLQPHRLPAEGDSWNYSDGGWGHSGEARRDSEWRKLEVVGKTKLDHPRGGSKDIFDAESVAVWAALGESYPTLSFLWVD